VSRTSVARGRVREAAALAKTACSTLERRPMNGLIYLIGLIVVIMFILSFLGLR
jgi:hypothetical protein